MKCSLPTRYVSAGIYNITHPEISGALLDRKKPDLPAGIEAGEHRVGMEKQNDMHMIYSDEDLRAQLAMREVFNPENLCNPGKLFPKPAR